MTEKNPEKVCDSIKSISEPFLKESDKSTLYPRKEAKVLRTHEIIKFIKEHQGTTAYDISKSLKFSYTETCRVLRDLLYVSAIIVKPEIFDGRARKLLYIPLEETTVANGCTNFAVPYGLHDNEKMGG